MRKAALAALLLVLVPLQASALEADELLGLVAMPLAVAAASEVTGVPAAELSHFVATLNRAQVPPTQVVQVVRYAPAALVVEDVQPTFIEFVDQQVDQGVTGTRLVTVIEDRYQTYDLDPDFVVLEEPATTYVVREDYIPPLVVTRVAQYAPAPAFVVNDTNDLLALAAMPLAVAAVADITGVPFNDLATLVSSLNAARVPPLQVVEVLRYSPVVLVDDTNRPQFMQFVETQVVSGVTAPRLISLIDDRLRLYDVTPQFNVVDVDRDVVFVDDDFFPPIVTTRVAEVRAHPHGGPPGQLKKQLGLKTGAEVVHGSTRRTRPTHVAQSEQRGRPSSPKVSRGSSQERRTVSSSTRSSRGRSNREVKRAEQPRVDRTRVQQQRVEQPKPQRVDRDRGSNKGGGNKGAGQGNQGGDNKGGQGKGKGKGKG